MPNPENREPLPAWPAEVGAVLALVVIVGWTAVNIPEIAENPLNILKPVGLALLLWGVMVYSQH